MKLRKALSFWIVGLVLKVNSVLGVFNEFSSMLSKTPPEVTLFTIEERDFSEGGA